MFLTATVFCNEAVNTYGHALEFVTDCSNSQKSFNKAVEAPWCSGHQYCTTYSAKPELRFHAGLNPARGVLEIHDGKDL